MELSMKEKINSWILSLLKTKDEFFFKGCGNIIYQCHGGVNSKIPTEITRFDIMKCLNLMSLVPGYNEFPRNDLCFFAIIHKDSIEDMCNMDGFIPRIDYKYPENCIDNEVGSIGCIRIISSEDDRLLESLFFKMILVETDQFLLPSVEFIIPQVINKLTIHYSKYFRR